MIFLSSTSTGEGEVAPSGSGNTGETGGAAGDPSTTVLVVFSAGARSGSAPTRIREMGGRTERLIFSSPVDRFALRSASSMSETVSGRERGGDFTGSTGCD